MQNRKNFGPDCKIYGSLLSMVLIENIHRYNVHAVLEVNQDLGQNSTKINKNATKFNIMVKKMSLHI